MPRLTYLICLVFLALTTGLSSVRAEEMLPPILQKLTDEASLCYISRDIAFYTDDGLWMMK